MVELTEKGLRITFRENRFYSKSTFEQVQSARCFLLYHDSASCVMYAAVVECLNWTLSHLQKKMAIPGGRRGTALGGSHSSAISLKVALCRIVSAKIA